MGNELQYMAEAVRQGKISADGEFTKSCQSLLESLIGAPRVLLTTSCTHALEMCALLLSCGPGDEIIMPSFTFPSTANAFVLRGAVPVFVDIRADTLNLDENLIEGAVTSRTKAILPVHYAGVACEMSPIMELASHHDVAVIEDNAHGLLGSYEGKALGTFGCLATQSFHETKNIACGEGGALVVNDESLFERAEVIRQKGTNRSRFFRGEVDKYTWVDVGSSYGLSDILAAYLQAQLEAATTIQQRRQDIWQRYYEGLSPWAERVGISLPEVPSNRQQAYHMFYLLLPSEEARRGLILHLKKRGILSVFHYIPLHLGEFHQGAMGRLPVTERVSERILRLPFYNDLDVDSQDYVIDCLGEFLC
ncbi:MAG: dTDP-4-amino-4,6-dideoxygalactose transaminase [Deltaproteobacteria bacterium]|nr:dTDP-4-amino-4,6-dideoxygalactose transaminase [Deltaproteobacteria bacterium]